MDKFVLFSIYMILMLHGCVVDVVGDHEDDDMFHKVMRVPGVTNVIQEMATNSMTMVKDQDMMFLEAGVDTQDTTSTTAMKAMFTNTQPRARHMGEMARSRNLLLDEMSALFKIPRGRMAKNVNRLLNEIGIEIQGLGTMDDECDQSASFNCDPTARYRTMDGTCNNLRKPIWGASFIPFRRFLRPAYDDDVSAPRLRGRDGRVLPSARRVSLHVHESGRRIRQDEETSHMLMQWGQFIDHDITSTPVSTGARGSAARCCREDVRLSGPDAININPEERDICFPIAVPMGDPQFSPKRCLNFVRSVQIQNTECDQAPVEQMNQITAFIDGSMIYGSSDNEMESLRSFEGGLLKSSKNDLLPENEQPSCIKNRPTDFCFKAGDARVNEQMGLATLHTVFMREHNRMARELSRLNPSWTDETLFQETRRIVAAKIQHITYHEFIPLVLGVGLRSHFGLISRDRGFDEMYDETADPSIRNVFASAAYRFGHSMVRGRFSQLDNNFRKMDDLLLMSTFGNTSHLIEDGGEGLNRYIRGLVTDTANRIDRFITPQVTQHLFQDRSGHSLDLAAINIQRGRDHGLPGYNEWRRWCNLPVATSFSRGTGGLVDHPQDAVTRLRSIYSHPDDIDLFVGGISENRVSGGLAGPTFSCILAHQFKALKIGDRFWYERDDAITGFTLGQVNVIKQTTLAQILCENTVIEAMQPNVFKPVSLKNSLRPCRSFTRESFNPWSEDPNVRDGDETDSPGSFTINGIVDDSGNETSVKENGNDIINNGNNDFNNGNNDFNNGNNDFNNGNNDFNNRINDFNNGNNDFNNGNNDFNNGNNDFNNGNNDFNNRNNDFNNGNNDFNNGNNDFDNGNNDFNNVNNDFNNGNNDFDNGNNDFNNENNDFNNGNNDFNNVNNDFNNGNIDFDNGNNDFNNGNNDFNNGNNNINNGNNDFNNGNNDFNNGNNDFNNGNNDFNNGNNNFNNGNNDINNVNNDINNGNVNTRDGNGQGGTSSLPSWSEWTICLRGQNSRRLRCPGRKRCSGSKFQKRRCGFNTWSDWSEWSTCQRGNERRKRRCTGRTFSCQGQSVERRPC